MYYSDKRPGQEVTSDSVNVHTAESHVHDGSIRSDQNPDVPADQPLSARQHHRLAWMKFLVKRTDPVVREGLRGMVRIEFLPNFDIDSTF